MKALQGGTPPWAKRIKAARTRLNLTQSMVGRELGFSAMAISRWERGRQEPPAEGYIGLGKMSSGDDRWFFFQRAGLNRADFQKDNASQRDDEFPLPMVKAGAGNVLPMPARVSIPVLSVQVGSHGSTGDNILDFKDCSPEEMFEAPRSWCPNPTTTTCLRLAGTSMLPSLDEGDILAVDSSQTKRSELNNKLVIAWHRETGLTVSRFKQIEGVDLLESDNRQSEGIAITRDRNWQIVGKVLWLIRKGP